MSFTMDVSLLLVFSVCHRSVGAKREDPLVSAENQSTEAWMLQMKDSLLKVKGVYLAVSHKGDIRKGSSLDRVLRSFPSSKNTIIRVQYHSLCSGLEPWERPTEDTTRKNRE